MVDSTKVLCPVSTSWQNWNFDTGW